MVSQTSFWVQELLLIVLSVLFICHKPSISIEYLSSLEFVKQNQSYTYVSPIRQVLPWNRRRSACSSMIPTFSSAKRRVDRIDFEGEGWLSRLGSAKLL